MDENTVILNTRDANVRLRNVCASILGKKIVFTVDTDNFFYLVRFFLICLESSNSEPDVGTIIRLTCNLPLPYENTEIDYYEHLDRYIFHTTETDVKDTGEAVFASFVLFETMDEIDYDTLLKVVSGHRRH